MKITGNQWIEIIRAISTAIIAIITTLCVQSCTMSLSVSKNNSNSDITEVIVDGHAYNPNNISAPIKDDIEIELKVAKDIIPSDIRLTVQTLILILKTIKQWKENLTT